MKTKMSDFSSEKKKFDCLVFKRKMQEMAWERSGAKNIDEHFDYLNSEKARSEIKTMLKPENVININKYKHLFQ